LQKVASSRPALVVGWADLCDENERRQYLTIAGQIEQMLASLRGE
jgi:hypothetical protein